MVETLRVTVKLVASLMETIEEVKTNYEDCTLLGRRVEQALMLLYHIDFRAVDDSSVTRAIEFVNEALKGAQSAIDDCCNTNFFCALLLRKMYASALKQATEELDHALFQTSLAALGITSNIQDDLTTLLDGRSHEKFEERLARAHHTIVLRREIGEVSNRVNLRVEEVSAQINQGLEEVSVQMNQRFEDVKNQLGSLVQKHGLRPDITGTLTPIAYLVKYVSDMVTRVKANKQGCEMLAEFVKRTVELLKTIKEKTLAQPLVSVALEHVKEALANVMQSINMCCNTNAIFAKLFFHMNTSRLKEASTKLGNALGEIAVHLHTMPTSLKSSLENLYTEIHQATFDGRVARKAQVDNSLKIKPRGITEVSKVISDYHGQFPMHFASSNNSVDTIKVSSSYSLSLSFLLRCLLRMVTTSIVKTTRGKLHYTLLLKRITLTL